MRVNQLRELLGRKLMKEDFVIDKTGVKTIEIVNASFVADEETIFGKVNQDYVDRELQWYDSMSRNVYDIPGGTPKIWEQVSDSKGNIISNYGWCIYSPDNHYQYDNVLKELSANRDSRRACAIYTRPTMWYEYNVDGRSDFCCTNAVQYLIRDDKLHAVVQMRSSDVVYGFRNDYAWQKHVLDKLSGDLNIPTGDIHWNSGSLHVYESMFYLVDRFIKTGEYCIDKKVYRELYPNSIYI